MPKGRKSINQGEYEPITTCPKCFKQWTIGDDRTLDKLFDLHLKLEHPNCIRGNSRGFDVVHVPQNTSASSIAVQRKADIKAKLELTKPKPK